MYDPATIGAMIPIVGLIVAAVIAIGLPIARAYSRRIESRPVIPPDLVARLERMDQSLEAIALEVERISEGQRFTTKLLAERAGGAHKAATAAGLPPGEQRA